MSLVRELVRFALVGGVGLVIDVSVFNLLSVTVLAPGLVHGGPLVAKVLSTSLAIAANWVGNRLWAFRDRRREDVAREGVEFAVASIIGLLVSVGCLWASHYVLGFTSLLADNVSSNVVGLGLGTALRFALYHWWVFGVGRGGMRPGTALTPVGRPSAQKVDAGL